MHWPQALEKTHCPPTDRLLGRMLLPIRRERFRLVKYDQQRVQLFSGYVLILYVFKLVSCRNKAPAGNRF